MSFRSDRAGMTLIRPLLDATREELRAYLRERGQRWREDASNRDPAHLRNRVRHDVLPALRRLNPRVVEAVTRAARWLREDEAELRASAMARARKGRADPEGGALDAVRLSRLPAPFRRRVWLRWLEARGAGGAAVDSALIERLDGLARLAPGPAEAPVPGGWIARLGGSEVRLVRRKAAPVRPPVVRLRIPGETVDAARGLRIRCAWARGYRRRRERGAGALPSVAWLDAARVKAAPALEVRAWRRGDRMRPWGLNGSRKVQDIFTDAGLDAGARRCAPILASGRTIVWIPGYRIAEGWGVPSRTAPALRLDALAWRGGARAAARSRRDRCPPGGGVVQSPA
jgi:tRNA(Ile)-lysidine synthase